jgi:hypothetical protein
MSTWADQYENRARTLTRSVLLDELDHLRGVELDLEKAQANSPNPLAELAIWQQVEARARIVKTELARREALARAVGVE